MRIVRGGILSMLSFSSIFVLKHGCDIKFRNEEFHCTGGPRVAVYVCAATVCSEQRPYLLLHAQLSLLCSGQGYLESYQHRGVLRSSLQRCAV